MEWRVRIGGLEVTLQIHRSTKTATTFRLQLCIVSLPGNRSFGIGLHLWQFRCGSYPCFSPWCIIHCVGTTALWLEVRYNNEVRHKLDEEQTQLEPEFKHKMFVTDFLQGIKMLQNDRKQTHCLHSYQVWAQEGGDHVYLRSVSGTLHMIGTLHVCCLKKRLGEWVLAKVSSLHLGETGEGPAKGRWYRRGHRFQASDPSGFLHLCIIAIFFIAYPTRTPTHLQKWGYQPQLENHQIRSQ